MEAITVVKIGGKIINDPQLLEIFLNEFSKLKGAKVLVHGGGKKASDVLKSMNITPNMVDGRRITDEETLEVVTMVYGGLINKNIVAQLQSNGVNALGLSGADGNIILSHKRIVDKIDYGFAGDIDQVNEKALTDLINAGFIPALCPLTHNGQGQMLNTNADTIASRVASALSKVASVDLLYCFELNGVMRDISDNESFIKKLSHNEVERLHKEGVISNGMIPKLDNGFDALRNGANRVSICHFTEMNISDSGTNLAL